MTTKEIKDLIKLIDESELSEFKMRNGDFELTIRSKQYNKGETKLVSHSPQIVSVPQAIAAPVAASIPTATTTEAPKQEGIDTSKLLEVKSPIVGTFYRSSSPDKPPFIKVGDKIQEGSVVCIVEAMKLFNEIESEVAGQVVKVMVEDASPIEYDQVLFLVDPNA